jgi:hypothetical protein
MTAPIRSGCPSREHSPEFATVVDWLAGNGIDEWVPREPTFTVAGDEITYTAYVYEDDQRGWDASKMAVGRDFDVLTEERTVPLRVPPTEQVRAAFAALADGDEAYRAALHESSEAP